MECEDIPELNLITNCRTFELKKMKFYLKKKTTCKVLFFEVFIIRSVVFHGKMCVLHKEVDSGSVLSKVLVYVMTGLYPSGKLFHLGKPEPVKDGRNKNGMLAKTT